MTFCTNCLNTSRKDAKAIRIITEAYLQNDIPWYVGYSGGKDSSALLTLVFNALYRQSHCHKPVKVIYCDTGVEIPMISGYVKSTIAALEEESTALGLPLEFIIATPNVDDRYFVKVIGRGYPPPTNIFRWCTDKLRINPVKSVIGRETRATVLLGVRNGESPERDRTISRHATGSRYYLQQGSSGKTSIFSPIIDYSLKEVWATLKHNGLPRSIDYKLIGQLYKDAGSECPVYKESKGSPCGKGRFGCWTCTVVRKDRSVGNMIENGYESMQALYDFRNWLIVFRDDPRYRCQVRRNGRQGPGPLTLEARKIILDKLQQAEISSGHRLIEDYEVRRIRELWDMDATSSSYREVCP